MRAALAWLKGVGEERKTDVFSEYIAMLHTVCKFERGGVPAHIYGSVETPIVRR